MSNFSAALASAIRESSAVLSTDLRKFARDSGWSGKDASSLSVRADPTGLSISSRGDIADRVEYGNENTPPNPAIRIWATDPSRGETALTRAVKMRMTGTSS